MVSIGSLGIACFAVGNISIRSSTCHLRLYSRSFLESSKISFVARSMATTDASSLHSFGDGSGIGVQYNFGPATATPSGTGGDNLMYGCQRPGASDEFSKPGAIPPEEVTKWTTFLKNQGVARVLCLLNKGELEFYQPPGYQSLVEQAGLKVTMCDVFTPNAKDVAIKAFEEMEQTNEKMAIHCSGGEGRTGVVMGAWLVHKKGMTPEEAEHEILEAAKETKTVRKPSAGKIAKFLEAGTLA